MQATKPVTFSPVSHNTPTQVKPQIFSKRIKSSYLGITIETTVKLFTNIVISVFVTSAFLKLWPHYQSIQEKLQVIESEIEATTERLNQEKADFTRYFDPSQAKSIMQEQSNRVGRHQIPIIWLEDNGVKPNSESTSSNGRSS
ncbi:MAG: hypothetical protein F6K18_11960 [Okeania sp. SIO2C2]|uniref:slr1601 family putative cell division protein n=1 Tax=Okeania sp. SIO2C2 TaxID=2607787 RepID=UPI0013B5D34D|nr:hypothetical protein [Okeania sp. SIO2C2]NEP87483.1 hypothetical protein [Okeania sp. SIO2C2]